MALRFRTEKSLTAGKSYVPSKLNVSAKNGLYKVQPYQSIIDPFAKPSTTDLNNATTLSDPFKQKVGYSPTKTTDDILNRRYEEYKGHKYDTYYDYGFPNDKEKENKKQEPKPTPKKSEPKKEPKPKPVEIQRVETPLPYNPSKTVSRTLMMISKNNRVRPSKTDVTDEFY